LEEGHTQAVFDYFSTKPESNGPKRGLKILYPCRYGDSGILEIGD
jgi:hypothetical protein